jgi:glycosyltransferase involved in cell wall biosynthesis
MRQLITVVIPTLGKRPEFLSAALSSVYRQSVSPLEVIVVNNGSIQNLGTTESSPIPIREFRIPLRAGVSQARNFGASIATGTYVSFLDDDDFWHPEYLHRVLAVIQESKPDIVLGRIDKFVNGETFPFMDASKYITKRDFQLFNPGATGSNTTISKESFINLGGYDCNIQAGEDGALILDALSENYRVVVEPQALSFMRMHPLERLTDPKSSIPGYSSFFQKYKSEMKFTVRLYNRWRISREKRKLDSNPLNTLLYLYFSFWISLFRITPKKIWPSEAPRK